MLKTKKEIKKWLDKHRITNYTINDDLSVDVDENVNLAYSNLTKIPVQFNKVNGSFICSHNQLKLLEGSPKEVNGSFWCHLNKLTLLVGSPKEISGSFSCDNNKLTNLKGAPKEVKGNFNCSNNQLTSLIGSPKKVFGYFYCYNNLLKSLKDLPDISGRLVCDEYLHDTKEYKVWQIDYKLREMV